MHLAKDCLTGKPPLSFFRNFIVEKDGEHKNRLDIKTRGLVPFVDFARVMALEARCQGDQYSGSVKDFGRRRAYLQKNSIHETSGGLRIPDAASFGPPVENDGIRPHTS